MAIYQATFSSAGVNAVDAVLANLKASSTDRAFLREVGVFVETLPTAAPAFGLKRMNAAGTGTITTATAANSDTGEGVTPTVLETAWATTRPTVQGGSFRRTFVPLALGNGVIWDFTNRPLVVPLSGGLCVVNLIASGTTVGQFGGYVVWED